MIRTGVVLLLAAALLAGAPAFAQVKRPSSQASDQPIEIIADQLEVQQDKQMATYTGKVDVVQGDMRLKADQLRIFYRQNEQQGSRPAPRQAAADPATMNNSIERIEAYGNVFVSSSTETGQGDTGIYNLDQGTIVLQGKQVVLTRGQNVLRGTRMVMNLDTGVSTVEADPKQGGRVRTLIVPQKKAN